MKLVENKGGRKFQFENEHGTITAKFTCEKCGSDFTVTPAPPIENDHLYNVCLDISCPSYDPERDISKWFDEGKVKVVNGELIPFKLIEGDKL